MGLTSSGTITVEPSTIRPNCVAPRLNIHPCSALNERDDNLGSGIDLEFFGGPLDAKTIPNCGCSRDGIRNGIHLFTRPDGTKVLYAEPAPRCFDKISESVTLGAQLTPPETQDTDQFLTGPINLTVKSGCYPQKVEYYIQVCNFRNTIGAGDDRYWQGFVQWQVTIDGLNYNTQNGQFEDVQDIRRRCQVTGNGGTIGHKLRPFVLPAESEANMTIDFWVTNTGPIESGSYNFLIEDGHILANCTEITSLAPLTNPAAEFC